MSVSVALAAYNGEKYIAEQINSVLSELGANDEIVVSDDNPSGKTRQAVLSFGDPRVRYIEGSGSGVVKNFENAIKQCTGDYIFLCDQDDVWLPGKVKRVKEEFDKGASLVLHNAEITDENLVPSGKTCFELYGSNSRFLKNFIRNSFVGCCMAFRREILDFTLPFPDKLPMHDWWIALAAIKRGVNISLIDEPLIYWRRHSGNVTGSPTSLVQKIKFRALMLSALIRHR